MRYFRQALALIREERLFSGIYIAGTALAVAFVMLIAEVYYVKVADIAPEVRRSTTYYLDYLTKRNDRNSLTNITHDTYHDLFLKMQAPECMAATMQMFLGTTSYMKLPDGVHDRDIRLKMTEPRFFDLYQFRFLEGKPFTDNDLESGRRVAVVTEDIAKVITPLPHREGLGEGSAIILINNLEFCIVGVVETPSALTEECVADVYVPYFADGLLSAYGSNFRELPLELTFSVPDSKREAFVRDLKEIEARYNAVHKDEPVDVTDRLTTHYAKVWKGIGDVFNVWNVNLWWYVTPAIVLLLLVPALNLSGMVASRMERRLPEMAVRKAFGAKRRTLFGEVIMENLILTLIGGVIGLCLAWAALYGWRDWVFYIFSDTNNMVGAVPLLKGEMFFGPAVFAIALIVCCVLNVLAATFPAWLSLRKPIVESMMIKK